MKAAFFSISLRDLVMIIALLLAIKLQFPSFADDPGVGWHLQTGEYISLNSRIPTPDPFLYSEHPRDWVSDQWLSDLVLFRVYEWGGWPLLYAALTAIYLLTFFALLQGALKHSAVSPLASTAAVLLSFKLAQVHFILRPVVFSFFLFAALLLHIYSPRQNGRRGAAKLLVTALIFLAWSNLHPSFFLGLGILALNLLFTKSRALAAIELVICTAVTFINPFGHRLHESIIQLGSSDYFMNLNLEWRALSLEGSESVLAAIMLVIALVSALFVRRSSYWRFELTTLLIFAGLCLSSVRFLPYFAIVAAIPFARAIDILMRALLKRQRLAIRFGAALNEYESKVPLINLPLLLSILYLVSCALIAGSIWPYKGGYGPSPTLYPYGALSQLNTLRDGDETMAVVSHPNWGGFITFTSEESDGVNFIKPFIDDRNSLLGEEFYRQYFDMLAPSGDLARKIKAAGASHVLLPAASQAGKYLKDNGPFPLIYSDNISYLFVVR
ncbi:MAG: hypothetical protein J5J00_05545 [Deltaproteobacteria bacterium]|nr:hypothetical protein [Deltaproteobacteria bacterium]